MSEGAGTRHPHRRYAKPLWKRHGRHSSSAQGNQALERGKARRMPTGKCTKSLGKLWSSSGVGVGFADSVCLVFGHLEAIALKLGVEKLTIDVE